MQDQTRQQEPSYLRFLAMIATSMIVMFFLTYANSYEIVDHWRFSEMRLFMTIAMGGSMMAIMMGYMFRMYSNTKAKVGVFVLAALMLVAGIWLARSQVTVDDVYYMEGMIPHHSIAILTSQRAGIEDPRVRALADDIIEAQRREIKEMEWLIDDIRANGPAKDEAEAKDRPIPDFSGAAE